MWRWNDAQSLMWKRNGAISFFEVICQISRYHGTKNRRFWTDALLFFKVIRLNSRAHATKMPICTRVEHLRTVNPVSMHWWLRSDAHTLTKQGRGALLFLKVVGQISSSNCFEFSNGSEMVHKAWRGIEEVLYCFPRSSIKCQGHTDNRWFESNLSKITRPVAIKSLRFALYFTAFIILWCQQPGCNKFTAEWFHTYKFDNSLQWYFDLKLFAVSTL